MEEANEERYTSRWVWTLGFGVFDRIDYQVGRRGNEGRSQIARHEKGGRGKSNRYMPIGIDKIVEMQDVAGGDILAEKVGVEIADRGDRV
jgi:hypothetical protein